MIHPAFIRPIIGLALYSSLAAATGCGASASNEDARENPLAAYSCDSAENPPPSKLLLKDDGVSGRYMVRLMSSVAAGAGVDRTAHDLAAKYEGRVRYVWTTEPIGFALEMPDENAPALAEESVVCFVEQDTAGRLGEG